MVLSLSYCSSSKSICSYQLVRNLGDLFFGGGSRSRYLSSLVKPKVTPGLSPPKEDNPSEPPPPTASVKVVVAKGKKPKPKTKRLSKSAELLSYIYDKGGDLGSKGAPLLPRKALKVTSSIPTTAYLIQQSVAEQIVQEIITHSNPDLTAPAIELSPGFGLLTAELLRRGFKNLTCLEDNSKLAKFLTEQLKVPVLNEGFDQLPKHHHLDKLDGGHRIGDILAQIKNPVRESLPNLLVFGAIPHLSLINFIIKCAVTQKLFYEEDTGWADPVYYIALGSKAYWVLSSTPSSGLFLYRPSAILFQLLFKSSLLKVLPQKAFVPWVHTPFEGKSIKFKLRNAFDPNCMYLVRLETNLEVIKAIGGKEHLLTLWYFVRHHLYSRKNAIVPQLEQWVPGSGARLIRKGYTIYSQFGQLSPQQILALYLEFTSWPEFPGSSFLTAVDKFHTRLDIQHEES